MRNLEKGSEYCLELQRGVSEEEIAEREKLSIVELYRIIEYVDIEIARKYLKYFCKCIANGICFCHPTQDEYYCNVGGYIPRCRLGRGY